MMDFTSEDIDSCLATFEEEKFVDDQNFNKYQSVDKDN